MNIDRIEPEYILSLQILFLFGISLLLGVVLEVVIDDAGEGCIANCGGDFFPALDACVFFIVD